MPSLLPARSQYSPASRWPSSNTDGSGRLPHSRQRARIEQNLGGLRRQSIFSSASNPGSSGLVMKSVRAVRKWTPGTDIFCNNKVLEEMAEAWKNEMSLG